MGGMDQAPARIDVGVIEQPCDGTFARPGQAILDLLDLLGGVDVHGAVPGERHDRAEFVWCDSAQAVRRDADIRTWEHADRLARGGEELRELIDRADEAALAVMRWRATEAAMRIKT